MEMRTVHRLNNCLNLKIEKNDVQLFTTYLVLKIKSFLDPC